MYNTCSGRHNMTDKEHRKLKNQLKSLQRLGLPADKSILTLLSQTLAGKQKLDKQKYISII